MHLHTHRRLLLALAAALLAVAVAPALAETPYPNDPSAGDDAAAQVARLTRVATRPSELRFGGTGVLWLTGDPDRWTVASFEGVKRWAARGHVAWVDVSLAPALGITDAIGGGSDEAFVPASAAEHPLATEVKSVRCMDTFRYMRGIPTGAQSILSVSNRDDHAIMAAWPMGKGLIVFRPQARPNSFSWMNKGERRWIEPDLADGGRLLHNLNIVTLAILQNAGFAPATP